MADGEGFVGRCEIVEPRRGNRRWPNAVKARIVAESLQPGVRVADVARRHALVAHQLSCWRRQARQGLLALPAELMPAIEDGSIEPAFVPLAIATEPKEAADASPVPELVEITSGIMIVEIGDDLVVRVPGDVPVDRVAALVRAMRGTA
ncbi:IS66-like element accessory protein TnpA [Labrys okinawensis]|uniref:IS66-like element accessory protein TnpA n=1 Tax=Labrys okinawensis TaxID=346911 RepID=UPI0039BD0DCB